VRDPATISSAGPPACDTDGARRVAAVVGVPALVPLPDGADVDVGRAAVVRRPAAHAPSTTPAAAARNPLRLTLTASSLRPRKGRHATLRYLATESGMNTASNPHIHARACHRGLNVGPPTHSARMASTV